LRSKLSGMSKSDPEIQRVRLFDSQRLERLSYITARQFICAWALIIPALVVFAWGTAGVVQAGLLLLAGGVLWIFTEYVMHRFLFHWETDNRLFRPLIFVVHGNHHIEPNDPLRGMMPFIISLPIAALLWLLFTTVIGPAGAWAHIGFLTGYITYDLTHYACHQWPMKSALGQLVKRHHMRHHYVVQEKNFAVTALFLDRLFGTHERSPGKTI
jgi:sterol desaturase/sphingolipid hydroxylase (fatty acid hydroxylase superfamily)